MKRRGKSWADEQRERWSELERWVDSLRAGPGRMTAAEVDEFTRLHRAAASDLLVAQSGRAGAPVVAYLNDLVGRSYARLYTWQARHVTPYAGFLFGGLPALIRGHAGYLLLAATIFCLGFAFGFGAVARDPDARFHLLPVEHQGITPQQRVAEDTREGARIGGSGQFMLFLTLHNLRIALLAFALGVFFGAVSAIVLFLNGTLIGALAADYHLAGDEAAWFFWAWILPHGIPELLAVCLAGAAGMRLGRAALSPGRRTTRDAVAAAAVPALQLFAGTIPLFLLAALIESTISQVHPPYLPYPVKLQFAGLLALALALYILGLGRRRPAQSRAARDPVWHRVRPGGLLEILTPEHVVFRYRLAGLGTRAVAATIDMLLIGGPVLLFALMAAALLDSGLESLPWLLAVLTLLGVICYFLIGERSARPTPGKRALGLTVLDRRGLGMTPVQQVLRAVFRAVDLLPFPGFYLLGFCSALSDDSRRRIGDRVAGTLVIQEGRARLPVTPAMERDWYLASLDARQRARIARRLTGEEADLLLELAARRDQLELSARLALFRRAREYFEQRSGWPRPPELPDERYLTALAWAALPQDAARRLRPAAEAAEARR